MNLRQLYCEHDVKLVPLKDKTRLTKKTQGYAAMNEDGIITYPNKWKRIEKNINNYGVLCDYIPGLKLYYCVLDIDSKEFPVMQILDKYPTAMTKTKHGYHLHYLSNVPCNIKQLIGRDKEKCPVDIRAKRDDDPKKEGNYIRLSALIGDTTDIFVVDFNEVVSFVYKLFNITPRLRGEYGNNVKEWDGKPMYMKKVSKKEYFTACYLYYQKNDWSSAYDSAFPWGVKLKGSISEEEAYNIAKILMNISDYPRPKKWIKAFMTGFSNANEGKAYFGKQDLKPEMRVFLAKRFNELNENEIQELAEILKDVKLYQIMELIQ